MDKDAINLNPQSPNSDHFIKYPAPIWESSMSDHFAKINTTLPYYGPMLYWIIRAIGAVNVLEIGVAQGYSSYFMASAIKDNNERQGMNGKYIGVDFADKKHIEIQLKEKGLPAEIWHMDSITMTHEMLQPYPLDLVFQDGFHNTEHCMKEMAILYPHIKDAGRGYLVMHDVYAFCEGYYKKLMADPRYDFSEAVRFLHNYGLAITRRMDNYDHDHIHWPDGDMKGGYVQ